MLSYHCPECNVPLFQEGDTIFCPSCQKEAVTEQEGEKGVAKRSTEADVISYESEIGKEEESLKQEQGTERKITKDNSSSLSEGLDTGDISGIENSLKNSLFKLSQELESTEDVKSIKEIVEVMDKITNLAERIKKL